MAEVNLGFIGLDAPPKLVDVGSTGSFRTEQDTFAFRTGSITANVNVSASFNGNASTSLALFRDNNSNGRLDGGDRLLPPSNGGTSLVSLSHALSQGNYIARVEAITANNLSYRFQLSRSSLGSANPLTTPEFQLGTIAQDLQRRNRVHDKDTADNFAFTLDGNSSLDIAVRELGNLTKGDVNIRVVQDLNSNGVVDKNEVVIKGTSIFEGNIDTITNLKNVGDYILQVCQSKGDARFSVIFEHSAA